MKKINIKYKNKDYEVPLLSDTLEVIEKCKLDVKDPVAVVVNGHFSRLNKKIPLDSTLDIIELSSPQGKRVYESSVMLLFLVAFEKLFPDLQVFIQHSIHKGIYAEVQGDELSKSDVQKIQSKMLELANKDLPINKLEEDWDTSINKMKESDRKDMVNLFKYYRPTKFKFYELDGIKENIYLPLVTTTGILKYFRLEKYRDGLVIVLPDVRVSKDVPEFIDRPKIFKSYQEYHEWSRILKVRTVGQLNKYIMNNEVSELIKVAEAYHEKRIATIADTITKRDNVPRLVLIAGPTSSGKTTFSKRLGVQLKVNGYRPVEISMDNYFVDREQTPRDEDGNYDFESLEAIDVPLFMNHIQQLLNGEEVELPKFDFISGKKSPSGKKLKLDSDQIIIIEGIHGINPKLTSAIDNKDKFKIYISALTQLNLHRHDRIPASDTRMIRRMVRDSYFRGYSASDTLGRWESVRKGEKKNIFPLQEEADIVYNSALFYELSVLKVHAERELLRVEKDDPVYPEAQRLLKFLSHFLPLSAGKNTPSNSILREFVGGSSFDY